MAEDNQDDSQKTEEPTEKRLREAREKGQVAKSQEVSHWFAILGLTMIVGFMLPGLVGGVTEALLPLLERPHDIVLGRTGSMQMLTGLVLDIALALLFPIALLVAARPGVGLPANRGSISLLSRWRQSSRRSHQSPASSVSSPRAP